MPVTVRFAVVVAERLIDLDCRDCAATFQDPTLAATIDNANAGGLLLLTELMQLGHPVSEDCLTVNVWTKPQTGEKKKVSGSGVESLLTMRRLYYFGYTEGVRWSPAYSTNLTLKGFNTGNSNNKIYDGQYLVDSEDVVVVSFK